MKNVSWDAYQLFLSVARGGGLSGAAGDTGLSPATLSRRMLDLEQTLGRTLFVRSRTGYTLTGEGERLRALLGGMEDAAREVAIVQGGQGASTVRLACGTWNARLLSLNITALRDRRDDFRLDIHVAEQRAQLAHREHDIGIRAFAPEERNLASVRLSEVAYAAYRVRNGAEATAGRWLAVSEEAAISAYLRWPRTHHADALVAIVNRPHALYDLVLGGAGMAVLPCFVGDLEPRMERAGDEIAELRHGQFLVMNNDDRHRPDIRRVADRLQTLLRARRPVFEGRGFLG
ncbi:LysR family transcriptional regulator [Rhizobium halophytocola]|uniref:DNA-binding transcriptional LysR family regulator n=1 Tax=Rhizobium halophytocola TaxID=735519 RepID=A0ABS4E5F6_9HYPH|nr:LysR family transcriptional regulator [Rhizobium halophytocola]MBP1853185.1 DNA-binding transcriptional LysR family regulator [Rhizobium halophytocola]